MVLALVCVIHDGIGNHANVLGFCELGGDEVKRGEAILELVYLLGYLAEIFLLLPKMLCGNMLSQYVGLQLLCQQVLEPANAIHLVYG